MTENTTVKSRITNHHDLPEAIIRATRHDKYHNAGSDFTVTQLISPPRIVALKNRYWKELTEDATDRIHALLGTSVHYLIERAQLSGLVEKRFFARVDGLLISGQVDHLEDGVLTDYKVMNVSEGTNGLRSDRTQQLNLLAALARLNGHTVTRLQVVSIYRNWSKTRAVASTSYPPAAETHEIAMWPEQYALNYLKERVALHRDTMLKSDNELPMCSEQDIWANPTPYAVMRKGKARAAKLCGSMQEALVWMRASGESDLSVVKREEAPMRCRLYCAVAPKCQQWAKWREENDYEWEPGGYPTEEKA